MKTTSPNQTANVAMLLDWENIKGSTIEYLFTPPDILTLKKIARFITRDHETAEAKEVWTMKFRVNIHHPRAQVVLGIRGHVQTEPTS